MPDLLWFLLPVAAFSGWWVAQRQYSGTTKANEPINFSSQYYEGLNYLLNEQPDKAVDIFVKTLPVNAETVEIHLALGSMFRRRGEIDRAILLHQNLIEQASLSSRQKEQVMFELGQDNLSAGLLDRAESFFVKLKPSKAYAQTALKLLIDVYQQEKDWQNAISAAHQYAEISNIQQSLIIAHYYCELAEKAIAQGDSELGSGYIKKAISSDPECIRASIIMANSLVDKGDYQAAVRGLRAVLSQNSPYYPELVGLLVSCYEKLGWQARVPKLLASIDHNYDNIHGSILLARLFARYGEPDQAKLLLEKTLDNKQSIELLSCYLELESGEVNQSAVLKKVSSMLRQQASLALKYLCSQCGFAGQDLHWQCPSCKCWSTIKPI